MKKRLFLVAVMLAAIIMASNSVIADGAHQDVFERVVVDSKTTFDIPGSRMYSNSFGVSPNEDFLLVVSREGYFQYPNIRREWRTTGYSIFASRVSESSFTRYDPDLNRSVTFAAPEASCVPRFSYYAPSNVAVYPSGNKAIALSNPGSGEVLFELEKDKIHSLDMAPCGTKIVYSISSGPNAGLWVYFLNTEDHLKLADEGVMPRWVLEGTSVVYETDAPWFNDSGLKLITPDLNVKTIVDYHPYYSTYYSTWDSLGGKLFVSGRIYKDLSIFPQVYDLKNDGRYLLDFLPEQTTEVKSMAPYHDYALAIIIASDVSGLYLLDFVSGRYKPIHMIDPREIGEHSSVVVRGENIYLSYGGAVHRLTTRLTDKNIPVRLNVHVQPPIKATVYQRVINPLTREEIGFDINVPMVQGQVIYLNGDAFLQIDAIFSEREPTEGDYVVDENNEVIGIVISGM
ncbi:MAG TPA: hypothetical protein PKI14_17780 [Fervidobacterium sp.]|nr:hypothetical protein [Fervidobacterium sp.]